MGNLALKTADDFLSEGHTPMMAQYMSVKDAHPDVLVFYRMGDFYEMFFDDAIKAAEILNITLTRRSKNQGEDIPMCGVPFHSCEPYIAKLIRAGHKVAICDQTETPEQAKARAKREGRPASKVLVNREVIRIITQGTLTEDTLLDARENNYLASLAETGGQFALAWLEFSTGAFQVEPLNKADIAAALERIGAKEILAPETLTALVQDQPGKTLQPPSFFDSENARARLEKYFGVGTLESFGGFSRAEISAAGALLSYVERTQVGKIPYIGRPRQVTQKSSLNIDAATRRNLELTRTLEGERAGSLLDCLDRTITGPGARLLQSFLSEPLADLNAINQRLNRVEMLVAQKRLRENLRERLSAMPDMERALSRLSLQRGGPRDLCVIRDGLRQVEIIRSLLQNDPQGKDALGDLIAAMKDVSGITGLLDHLKQALAEDPPFLARDGGFIKQGHHAKLDELKTMRDESRRLIASLQGQYQQVSGIDSLKIKYNNVLGYFIEVPAKRADALMRNDSPFIHRQTTANGVRFTTTDLAELERDILSAADKALALEMEIFETLSAECIINSEEIASRARAVATIDVAAGLAELAVDENYTRPVLDESLRFEIKGGRHPVVERALKKQAQNFIANDCNLGPAQRLWLLTGPNMAGKSTYLRQNALITILAQMGSFVPADNAHIGLVDRVFSRVGAADDLARGRSTFMVEMVETAAILNQATERSLVILDEIGRGTATFDGLSIAWACVEHLHEVNKCRGLFATHYHELTALTSKLTALSCHAMQVKEWKGDIIFLHSVAAGNADKSYGIHVGKLAGLPAGVLTRAQEVLDLLQKKDHGGDLTRMAGDLPLFTTQPAPQKTAPSALETRLTDVNPDALTPKEALDLLYDLKNLAN